MGPWSRFLLLVSAAVWAASAAGSGAVATEKPSTPLDVAAIRAAAGTEPTVAPDGVVRLSWPRTDIAVMVDGVSLAPSAGLASWAALAPTASGAVLMGDTAVFGDEVDAAIDAAFASDLEVTALHNHFFFDTTTMHGTTAGASMGVTTWAAFSGSDAAAAISGDLAMTAEEVQPVLRALRRAGIHVVALHQHMIGEAPTLYFTHFWAQGPAQELARGSRAALDAQGAATKGATARPAH